MRKLWSLPDDKLYQLGRVEEMFGLVYTHGLHYINKTWLDKFNLPVPQTTEEYKQALKTFVKNDANGNGLADEIGFSFLDSKSGVWRNHGNMDSLFGSFIKWDASHAVGIDRAKDYVDLPPVERAGRASGMVPRKPD